MVFSWILQYLNDFGTRILLEFLDNCVIHFKLLPVQIHGPGKLLNIVIFVHFGNGFFPYLNICRKEYASQLFYLFTKSEYFQ